MSMALGRDIRADSSGIQGWSSTPHSYLPGSLLAETETKAGYVALVGIPNAGKSSLMNRVLGEHLSIVTSKAQTTWQRVTGVHTEGDTQFVFLDTPGLLAAKDLFQRSMLGAALEALAEADVVLVVIDGTRPPNARDTGRLERALEEASAPVVAALNKVDTADAASLEAWGEWVGRHTPNPPIRVSAQTGKGVKRLLGALAEHLPVHPFLYPADEIASEPVRFFVAELVRETVFEQFHQEIPYSVFCVVEDFREAEDPVYIGVTIFVERASQKGMVIGAKGSAIRALGQASRKKIETFLGRRVYLDLWVKPLKSWRKNRTELGRLGFRLPPEDER